MCLYLVSQRGGCTYMSVFPIARCSKLVTKQASSRCQMEGASSMTRCSTLSPLQQSAFEWMQDKIVLLHYPISRQHCDRCDFIGNLYQVFCSFIELDIHLPHSNSRLWMQIGDRIWKVVITTISISEFGLTWSSLFCQGTDSLQSL